MRVNRSMAEVRKEELCRLAESRPATPSDGGRRTVPKPPYRLGDFAATPTPWVRLRLLPNGKADYYGSNVIEQIATCTIICQKTSP